MAKEFYQLIRSFGGLSLEYASIQESDFTATAGAAYNPPERGDFRRIAGSRQIQLLSDCPGVVETFQTSAAGELFLPANTVADNTNDAGDGRVLFIKNSSASHSLILKDYLGTTLWTMPFETSVMVIGNDTNNWDFYFKADDINFDNSILGWALSKATVQQGIEFASTLVKVSTNDTTADNLINKVVEGDGITVVETNDGGNETITINATVEGKPRYVAQCGRDGTQGSGTYLQFFRGINSNTSPFVVPEDSEIKALSVSTRTNSTVTYTIYKNGTSTVVDTISLSSASSGIKTGISHSLSAGDTVTVQVTSGLAVESNFSIFLTVVD